MVQRRVAYLGFLGQQVTGFPEERGLRIKNGPDHPRIKIFNVRWSGLGVPEAGEVRMTEV
jgi:hypothetical protein